MPMERRPGQSPEQEEYRRRQAQRAQRRKKRRTQQIIILGALLLGVVVVVAMVVLVVRAIIKPSPRPKAPSSSAVSSSMAAPQTPVAADPNVWNLLLINAQSPMPEGFAPELGEYVQNGVTYYLDARMLGDLERMIADCNAVEGNSLHVLVAAPGADKQNAKYQNLIETFKAQGNTDAEAEAMAREVEPPYGYSDHQTCLAVDFGTATVTEPAQAFAQTPEYAWLTANAPNYGFILRFPENKAAITGITAQPYHFRYVGAADATAIMGAGICLEEYVAAQPAVPPVISSGSAGASSSMAEG